MILVHKITKDREGLYYTVPFSVPENVIKITVSYDYYKPTKGMLGDLKPSNTIDVGLMDEKGNFLGWSGSAHKNISVGEYESSAGYLTQRTNSGEWQKQIFEYELLKNGDLLTRAKEKDIQIVS